MKIAKQEGLRFYENPSKTYCLDACCMMVLNSMGTATWDEMAREIDHRVSGAWMVSGAAAIAKRIQGVRMITTEFNYEQFSREGAPYLRRIWSRERYECERQTSSPRFRRERQAAKELLQRGSITITSSAGLTRKDIEKILKDDFVIARVDPHIMDGEPSENMKHAIVLYGQDRDTFTFHDPGLPSQKGATVSKNILMNAFTGEAIIVPKQSLS